MKRIVCLSVCAAVSLFALQFFLSSATAEPKPAQQDQVIQEIKALLTRQEERWNAGDIDGFMAYYWKSEELTFSSGGTMRRGWDATMNRYKLRYTSLPATAPRTRHN